MSSAWTRFVASSMMCALLFGCGARLPLEPPKRVLSVERTIAVVVDGPRDVLIRSAGLEDRPGESLGYPPVTIDRLSIIKESWKYNPQAPPPPSEESRWSTRDSAPKSDARTHAPLQWVVYVHRSTDGPPVRVEFDVSATRLEAAFTSGRLELEIPPEGLR